MYTEITWNTRSTRARKFTTKAKISSRKLSLAGQKIAGDSSLDMLLHYIRQDKIFPFPEHLPAQAGSCACQERARLTSLREAEAWISSCALAHLSCSLSTRLNFLCIQTERIKRDFIPIKAEISCITALLCAGGSKATSRWDPHTHLGGLFKKISPSYAGRWFRVQKFHTLVISQSKHRCMYSMHKLAATSSIQGMLGLPCTCHHCQIRTL